MLDLAGTCSGSPVSLTSSRQANGAPGRRLAHIGPSGGRAGHNWPPPPAATPPPPPPQGRSQSQPRPAPIARPQPTDRPIRDDTAPTADRRLANATCQPGAVLAGTQRAGNRQAEPRRTEMGWGELELSGPQCVWYGQRPANARARKKSQLYFASFIDILSGAECFHS